MKKENTLNNKKSFIIKIIINYIVVISMAFLAPYVMGYIVTDLLGDNTGIDGIGPAIVIILILRVIRYVILFIAGIILPIIYCIVYNKNKETSVSKRIICSIAILFPIIISLLPVCSLLIGNVKYEKEYNTSSSSYIVKPEDYKKPIEFYNELENRGLLFDTTTEELMNKLNADNDCINFKSDKYGNIIKQKCYVEATMAGIDKSYYYDSIDNGEINNLYDEKYPVYIYNSILTLPGKDDNLQYAAIGRFSYNSSDYGNHRAFFEDYYIECKIMYVDGNIYAIIGVSEAYDIERYFFENDPDYKHMGYVEPHYMIISEKSNITTYVNGKYHSKGAIKVGYNNFEMKLNTAHLSYESNYTIKEVNKLDKATLDNVAHELQDSVLKDSIEAHFIKRKIH